MRDPTTRFSTRVENYLRYRPDYPAALVPLLASAGTLTPGAVVADLGSGTGRLTERFLEHGHRTFAVEPNDEMREAAERLLGDRDGFVSVGGRAEATTLDAGSVDLVVAGQAFHWFDLEGARRELRRVLRPDGSLALVWNARDQGASELMVGYERLLARFGTDYHEVSSHSIDAAEQEALFGAGRCRVDRLPHAQRLDRAGLAGRALSASYMPEPGHPRHAPMLAALEALFERHAVGGTVELRYETVVYHGRFAR